MQNVAVSTEDDYPYHSARNTRRWNDLREIVRRRSFSTGETKILSSGRVSHFYFDMKRTMSNGRALEMIAELMLAEMHGGKVDLVGGLAMGAIPILNAVSIVSCQKKQPIDVVWIRKQAKGHGTKNLIEGQEETSLKGKTIVMVDDVTTTGGSVLEAVKQVEDYGAKVERVITIVDRCEGAREELSSKNIALTCLFNADDFRASPA